MKKILAATAIAAILTGCNQQPQIDPNTGAAVAQQSDGLSGALMSGGLGAGIGYMLGRMTGRGYTPAYVAPHQKTVINRTVIVHNHPIASTTPIVKPVVKPATAFARTGSYRGSYRGFSGRFSGRR